MSGWLGEISWDQFLAWYAFHTRVELIGEERADIRMGTLAALIANMFGKKSAKRLRPLDFMPYTEKPKAAKRKPIRDAESWQRFKAVFKGMFAGKQPRP